MANFLELLERVMTLTSNVDDLKSHVNRIDDINRNHQERIVRLEAREEVIIEKSRSTAIQVVSDFSNSLTEKIVDIKHQLKSLDPPKDQ